MQKYSGFKEIRFKVPDQSMQLYEDMALYLYEKKSLINQLFMLLEDGV
jgi:hypothetical protein